MARVALENSSALAWPDAVRHPNSYGHTVADGKNNNAERKRQVTDLIGNRICDSVVTQADGPLSIRPIRRPAISWQWNPEQVPVHGFVVRPVDLAHAAGVQDP
jgi:hypothetical protein